MIPQLTMAAILIGHATGIAVMSVRMRRNYMPFIKMMKPWQALYLRYGAAMVVLPVAEAVTLGFGGWWF